MRTQSKQILTRAAIGIAASIVIGVLIRALVNPGSSPLTVSLGSLSAQLLEPRWLYLVTLTPYFFVVRTLSLTDVSVVQQYLSTATRSVLVVLIAFALARPVWTTIDNKIATIVLVDVSDSISDQQLDKARSILKELRKAKRKDDRVYVATFAERPHLLRDAEGSAGIARHSDGGAGTNIQAALQLAYGVFPDGYVPRVIVLTDGNQTSGDLLVESYRAKDLGVRISHIPLSDDRPKEIRIASLRLPDEIKVGQPFNVEAQVFSTHAETITVTLRQDEFPNPLQPSKKVELKPGNNIVKFKSEAKRAGFTTYRARLTQVNEDTESANNSSVMTAPVKGKPHILYIEGSATSNPTSASYLKRALESQHMDVEVRGHRGLTSSVSELKKYDLVFVSDVPAHFMGMSQMVALEKYVRDGGGLIMSGGEDSFGSGGYQNTRIEKIMPVRFDSDKVIDQPNIAIVLVIDRSGSMRGDKLEAAKESAAATVRVLNGSDYVGIVAFDNNASTLVRLKKASNRTSIALDIARLTANGGTNILPALREAHEMLQGVNAKVKHVILLSDGQAPASGIAGEVQDMRANRITVSAVGIGQADRGLLQMIVENGDGKLYFTQDLSALPRIFMKETTEAKRSALVEDPIRVLVAKRSEMIEGINLAGAPALRGYVSTKPKPTGEIILKSDLGEPILARWRLGSGTSVAWTSDVKNRWAVDWVRWGGFSKFWGQVVRSTMRRKVYNSYDLTASVADGHATVIVDAINDDDRFVNKLDTTLEIIDPKNAKAKRVIPMVQTAAGRYTASFAIDRYGSYVLKAIHRRDGQVVAESVGAAALPYPDEYQSTAVDTEALIAAALVTGGVANPEPAKIFDPGDDSISYIQELWPWILLLLAIAIIVDVLLKRIRIFGYRTVRFD